ncbi:MAG: 2Fe-2S iron-sulfur cluster-binding protein [Gemmatimonadales bacterium]
MSDRDMVTLTIEGAEVTVPKGTTVLEAAKQAGIVVPHYCYHPGLPVAGVCRMCLVEIEGVPKLQIGCATTVADGQNVRVYSDEAKKARQSVLEFLLINHPLDCPICDQAGECELQNYVFEEGRARTRYTPDFPKRFNPVEDFGDDIIYVPNRCILCTRCVRFMEHVADDGVLNVSERGDRAFIGIHPGERLDHPWAGNVVDLCPVGSLISKDFLHKARAWDLDKTASICTGCSQGCNVTIDSRSDVVVRIRPRVNLSVNEYFMCDHGRLEYKWMNRGDRIEAPLVAQGGELVATDWDHALAVVAGIVSGSGGKAAVLASPRVSTEMLFLARELVSEFQFKGSYRVDRATEEFPLPGVDNLGLRRERAPNVMGARLLGYGDDFDEVVANLDDVSLVMVLDEGLRGVNGKQLEAAANIVYLGTVLPDIARSAVAVLPVTNTPEEDGTFVNRDGRVQRYFQAKTGPGMARPGWWVLGEILAEMGRGEPLSDAAQAFDLIPDKVPAFAKLSYDILGYGGQPVDAAELTGAAS